MIWREKLIDWPVMEDIAPMFIARIDVAGLDVLQQALIYSLLKTAAELLWSGNRLVEFAVDLLQFVHARRLVVDEILAIFQFLRTKSHDPEVPLFSINLAASGSILQTRSFQYLI